jgi:glycerate-2-kinase
MVSLEHMRRDARAAYDAAVRAVQPQHLVPNRVRHDHGHGVTVDGRSLPDVSGRRVVMAIGKAAPGLAAAWMEALPGWTSEAFVLTTHGVELPIGLDPSVTVLRGAHPYPDPAGEAATRQLLQVARSLSKDDLLLVLLSGGGSALMAAPDGELQLSAVRQTTEALLKVGAAIGEVNTVRRQLLAAAGGGLARAAWPATVETLILSDVLGDPVADIASGPTVPSTTGPGDALEVLDRFGLRPSVPAGVLDFLTGATAVQGDRTGWESATSTHIIGNNRTAVNAAAGVLESKGWSIQVVPQPLVGEASERGRELAASALRKRARRPEAEVYGGETTVTVRGDGRGGRNQELALAAAIDLAGTSGIVLLAAGTDGIDGQSDNAGAVVDGGTLARIAAAGHDAAAALRGNDSATVLDAAHDSVRTGPTGTNVCDLALLMVAPKLDRESEES